jgi:hypothetical protein
MAHSRRLLVLASAAAILGSNCGVGLSQPAAVPVPKVVLIFDMPHGGCRMRVMEDGSAALSYGALDTALWVRSGSFEPRQLVSAFQAVAVPAASPGARSPQPVGTVVFDRAGPLMYFSDEALAQKLFREALLNLVPRLNGGNPKGRAVVLRACGGREAGE